MFEGNPQDPATKSDLQLLTSDVQSLEGRMPTQLEMLRSEMRQMRDDLKESFRDSTSEVLKAIYSFAQSNSRRFVELEGNEAALRGRLGIIEDRLLEVEKRVGIPPIN